MAKKKSTNPVPATQRRYSSIHSGYFVDEEVLGLPVAAPTVAPEPEPEDELPLADEAVADDPPPPEEA